MIAAVQPNSTGFGGGSYVKAPTPTGVGGALGAPGTTASSPAAVPSAGVIEARNNRGSNVTLPYARLVPMHGTVNPHDPKGDKRMVVVNGKPEMEYTGLRSGELCWILGRRFQRGGSLADSGQPNKAQAGIGNGVDRFQRMASTGWIQGLIETRLGKKAENPLEIKLHSLRIESAMSELDSELKLMRRFLAGSTPLFTADVAWAHGQLTGNAPAGVSQREKQGVLVGNVSPFLTGMQQSGVLVRFGSEVPGFSNKTDMDRFAGDGAAFAALEVELRRRNLSDWTPDGIVLSKLESPTDEPFKSTELDARGAQLYNVAVGGAAITTSWTSDVRDHRLQMQPGDKLFVVVVATLYYTVSDNDYFSEVEAAQQEVIAKMKAVRDATAQKKKNALPNLKSQLDNAIAKADTAAEKLVLAVEKSPDPVHLNVAREMKRAEMGMKIVDNMDVSSEEKRDVETALADAQKAVDKLMAAPNAKELKTMNRRAAELSRSASKNRPVKAVLRDFRLMRTTSSHLLNYGAYKPGDKNSRCGLMLTKQKGSDKEYSGAAEYIIGGWCIGTALDSAASRSVVGSNLVRTAPTSHAVQANINIGWWSASKMASHYKSEGVLTRGEKRKLPEEPAGGEDGGGEDGAGEDGAGEDGGTDIEFLEKAGGRGGLAGARVPPSAKPSKKPASGKKP